MTKTILSKLFGGASVFINEIVEKGIGAQRLEKASLNEIKEKLDEVEVEQKNYQATFNIMNKDLETLEQKIAELVSIRDMHVAKFKETNDEKFRGYGIKAIEMIKKEEAKRDEKQQEIADHKISLDAINNAVSELTKVYEDRLKQHESAVSRSAIAQGTSKAADLIEDISSFTNANGNSKFAEETRHQEELAKLKMAGITKGGEDNVDDFIKQSKAAQNQSSSSDEFDNLLK
ncbi:hypothetical protein ACTOJ1_000600 [Shigella flexneri]